MDSTRRTYLLGVTAIVPLAGCVGDDDDGAGNGDDMDDGDAANGGNETDAADGDGAGDDGEGGEDDGAADDGNATDDDGTGGGATTLEVLDHAELGEILVDGEGMVLYAFDSDEQGANTSTCYDGCEANWPPFTAEDIEPGADVEAALTTFERNDGSTQIAADGWPLYYYAADEDPGEASGQGANQVWWVVRPDGTVHRGEDGVEGGTGG